MKKLLLTMMVLVSAPAMAQQQEGFMPSQNTQQPTASLSESDVQSFNNQYIEAFTTCDQNTIGKFIETHYADDYMIQLQVPNGEVRQGNKNQIKQMAFQGVQMMQKINGPDADCRPDMTLDGTDLSGNGGVMQTTQKEEITVPQNGKMVGVRANTTCQHKITKQNGNVVIQQSQCKLYQE